MEIKKVVFMYFSPTQSTKKVLGIMKDETDLPTEEFDLTDITTDTTPYVFDQHTLLVLGIPVYSGRVPKTATQRFERLEGHNTPIALVATYGNRAFDDALLELKNITAAKGFYACAAAAVITEHSIVPSIATGRPNADDIIFIKDFTAKLFKKLVQSEKPSQLAPLLLKGNLEYCTYHSIPVRPKGTASCNSCGLCVSKCPVGAIQSGKPTNIDKNLCISCMRCVQVCPMGGKKLSSLEQMMAKKSIESKCKGDKLPEMFL